jgi:hypothetical protein
MIELWAESFADLCSMIRENGARGAILANKKPGSKHVYQVRIINF